MAVQFYEQDVKAGKIARKKLSSFLRDIVSQYRPEVKKLNLTYIFCSDEYLLGINQQFLNHDTYTDIITFDLSEKQTELIGEIYISIERTADNATRFKVPPQQELHRVIFHGALHLCGFKDKKPADKKIMSAKEDECLSAWNERNNN